MIARQSYRKCPGVMCELTIADNSDQIDRLFAACSISFLLSNLNFRYLPNSLGTSKNFNFMKGNSILKADEFVNQLQTDLLQILQTQIFEEEKMVILFIKGIFFNCLLDFPSQKHQTELLQIMQTHTVRELTLQGFSLFRMNCCQTARVLYRCGVHIMDRLYHFLGF